VIVVCCQLITRPEELSQLLCFVLDLETFRMRRSCPALGCSATEKKTYKDLTLFDMFRNPSERSKRIWPYHCLHVLVARRVTASQPDLFGVQVSVETRVFHFCTWQLIFYLSVSIYRAALELDFQVFLLCVLVTSFTLSYVISVHYILFFVVSFIKISVCQNIQLKF
jgi:hypothetical protein